MIINPRFLFFKLIVMELYKIVLSFVLAGLCFVVGLAVFFRKRQEILNRIFLGVFLSYTVFFLFDAMIGLFFMDAVLANLNRDISSLASITGHSFVFLSGIYIWKGKEMLKNRHFLLPFTILSAVIGILGQFDDWVEIDMPLQAYTIKHGILGLACAYLYGAALILTSILIYFKIYAQTENPEIKTRLRRIVTGLLIVVAGQAMQAVLMATISESIYYALVFPEALVYTSWALGILIASRALWK